MAGAMENLDLRPLHAARKIASRSSDELQKYFASVRSRRHQNAVFIWIPKTGGTSVYTMLNACGFVKLKSVRDVRLMFGSKGRATFGHMMLSKLVEQGLINRQFLDSAFKFTVVRDPYARAISCYNHANKRGYLSRWKRIPNFTEFLGIIGSGFIEPLGTYNNLGLSFCNPQSEWLRGIEVDRVFKLESLAADVSELRTIFGCPELELGHRNRSDGIEIGDIKSVDRELISEIYGEDFERFGYPV